MRMHLQAGHLQAALLVLMVQSQLCCWNFLPNTTAAEVLPSGDLA